MPCCAVWCRAMLRYNKHNTTTTTNNNENTNTHHNDDHNNNNTTIRDNDNIDVNKHEIIHSLAFRLPRDCDGTLGSALRLRKGWDALIIMSYTCTPPSPPGLFIDNTIICSLCVNFKHLQTHVHMYTVSGSPHFFDPSLVCSDRTLTLHYTPLSASVYVYAYFRHLSGLPMIAIYCRTQHRIAWVSSGLLWCILYSIVVLVMNVFHCAALSCVESCCTGVQDIISCPTQMLRISVSTYRTSNAIYHAG